jgi:hypothetical protein
MAYDSARRRVVLLTRGASPLQTWEWDGGDWIQRVTASVPARRDIVYDSARERVVIAGSWEYGPTHPAAYPSYGTGCAGSSGTPRLAAAPGQRPWIGSDFTIQVTQVPANTTAVFLLGLSRTSWGALALPFPLAPIGMPGCALFASGEFLFVTSTTSAGGVQRLPIPAEPELVGARFYNQVFVVDPPANQAGLGTSNACEGRVGAR